MTIIETVFDLCIIGSGMFGSAAARHASANASLNVCLIGPEEPREEDYPNRKIFGAYYDEGRIVEELDPQIANHVLAKKSFKSYRELERLSGIRFYSPIGFMCAGKRNSTLMESVRQTAEATNVGIVDLSYGDVLEKRYPFFKFKEDEYALLSDTGAGYINPRRIVEAQKKVARQQGCKIISEVVMNVKNLVKGAHEIITESGRKVLAKRVLIATGAFTKFNDFDVLPPLKIEPKRETVTFLRIPEKEARRLSSMPTMVYQNEEENIDAYILPPIKYPDGKYYLKLGRIGIPKVNSVTSVDDIKQWYLSSGNQTEKDVYAEFLIDLLPGVKVENISSKTCITCGSPTGLPYIDRITPTVTVAAVGNGKGAKLSDEVGRLASHLSLTGKWDSKLPKRLFDAIFDYKAYSS